MREFVSIYRLGLRKKRVPSEVNREVDGPGLQHCARLKMNRNFRMCQWRHAVRMTLSVIAWKLVLPSSLPIHHRLDCLGWLYFVRRPVFRYVAMDVD